MEKLERIVLAILGISMTVTILAMTAFLVFFLLKEIIHG